MAQGIRRIHESVDYDEMTRLYPPPAEYFEARHYEPRETIEARQLARLQDRALRAYVALYLREEVKAEGMVRNLDSFGRFLDRSIHRAGGARQPRRSRT